MSDECLVEYQNEREGNRPIADPEVEGGARIEFLLKVGSLYCERTTSPTDPRTVAPWNFKIRETKQHGGATILPPAALCLTEILQQWGCCDTKEPKEASMLLIIEINVLKSKLASCTADSKSGYGIGEATTTVPWR